jgi:hypothetical protein
MNDLLTEAKQIIANNRTDKAARDLLTTEQREVITEDFLSRKEFLSASHFTPSAEKRQEFERLFWEHIRRKEN